MTATQNYNIYFVIANHDGIDGSSWLLGQFDNYRDARQAAVTEAENHPPLKYAVQGGSEDIIAIFQRGFIPLVHRLVIE